MLKNNTGLFIIGQYFKYFPNFLENLNIAFSAFYKSVFRNKNEQNVC